MVDWAILRRISIRRWVLEKPMYYQGVFQKVKAAKYTAVDWLRRMNMNNGVHGRPLYRFVFGVLSLGNGGQFDLDIFGIGKV